jgi:two-component system sensor histidine kinase KdpD
VPDAILELASDVVLVDTTPETLRERLRAGKIYPRERVETALANFFRTENLAALRELDLREVMHARTSGRRSAPFARLLLGVKARERDVSLIERCARFALRLEIELSVAHVARARRELDERALAALEAGARRARAHWISSTDDEPLAALLAIAAQERATTIAIEGARAKPRWPSGQTFARRLLDAGAHQLLILAPNLG